MLSRIPFVTIPCYSSFGGVDIGEPVLLPDDFGRVELAINQGNFAFTFGVKRGDMLTLRKKN